MANTTKINNDFYDSYGEKWYTAQDDPIALLRAENRIKITWVAQRLSPHCNVLDVGCGAGFLCNGLSLNGHRVTGIDSSPESLRVAKLHDQTASVNYRVADAYSLPFPDQAFDVVTCMDFLEHVERPADVIRECSRVLAPNGKFFFHTFNRNFISWLLVIKAIEFMVKNTPRNMHVIELFIKPQELQKYCLDSNIRVDEMSGLMPKFSTIPFKNYLTGVVPESMEFRVTPSLLLSYIGVGTKLPS